MKIAHIVCSYPPYYSGMGNVVFQTAHELNRRGHSVEVITPGTYQDREIKPADARPEVTHDEDLQQHIDYAKRLTPTLRYGNAARLPTIKSELDRFDLVHLHYPFFGTANLVRKWKLRNPHKPLVVTYHMDTRGPGWKGLIFKYYSTYWMPKILGAADVLIASSFDFVASSQAAQIYAEHKEKWVEIPFGVDTERFTPRAKDAARIEQLGLDREIPIILFVGGMDQAHYFKGVPVLLQALSRIQRQGFQLQAVFVGDGGLREGFQLQAKGMRLADSVRFVGRVSDEELPLYYHLADLTVLPSTTQGEAFGMVLLESMSSGIPVIASDLPGVRKVANDGGVVVRPNDSVDLADSIVAYFSGETDRAALSQDVRAVVEQRYTWPSVVEKLEEIYSNLVA